MKPSRVWPRTATLEPASRGVTAQARNSSSSSRAGGPNRPKPRATRRARRATTTVAAPAAAAPRAGPVGPPPPPPACDSEGQLARGVARVDGGPDRQQQPPGGTGPEG